MASKYWQKMHKYRLRIPHTVKEAIDIDKENGDTLWWDAQSVLVRLLPIFSGRLEYDPVSFIEYFLYPTCKFWFICDLVV